MSEKIPDIVKWAESPAGFYLAETKKPIKLAPHQAEILRHVLTPGPDGRLPYDEIVYSTPKKGGKTTIGALVAEYFALFHEAPNEVYLVANDLEQAIGRVYRVLERSIRLNAYLESRTTVQTRLINLDNGTSITPLASDYAGAAGSNHGLTVWDELWAYTTESARRLWDELTPVPTRKNSIRFVVTYAGFEVESELLWELYQRGIEGEPVPGLEHIGNGEGAPACRSNGRTFIYWDHGLKPHPGLTVSPDEYHDEQRRTLRIPAYLRLHENRWTTNESAFLPGGMWEACRHPNVKPLRNGDKRRVVFGADASTSRDCTALVGLSYEDETELTDVVYCKVWKPRKGILRMGKPTIDLDTSIGAEILRLFESGNVEAVYYDPYQLHSIALALEKAGVKMVEFPQTARRIESDQSLYDAVIARTLRHFGDPQLNEHIKNAVAVESVRGWRLSKEKTSRHIDAAVALSMAHYGAVEIFKTYGEPQVLPNIFYAWSHEDGSPGDLEDFANINGYWEYLPNRNRRKHPEGITWENCRHRNRGCEACIDELTREGYYREQQEEVEGKKPRFENEEEYRQEFYEHLGYSQYVLTLHFKNFIESKEC
jgi:phage terminase large subunit-like protein